MGRSQEPSTGGEVHDTAERRISRLNRLVDCRAIERFAVRDSPISARSIDSRWIERPLPRKKASRRRLRKAFSLSPRVPVNVRRRALVGECFVEKFSEVSN